MRVMLESPFAGDIERNLTYARRAMRDSLQRGEHPIASHLLYTQPGILIDTIPAERARGIGAGFAWHDVADMMVVYYDLGFSRGMLAAMQEWRRQYKPLAYRMIGAAPRQENGPTYPVVTAKEQRLDGGNIT